MPYSSHPYTFDRVVRIIFTVILLAFAVWLIDYLKDVLLPFCVACLMAYILEPFVQWNRQLLHLRGRTVAVFVTLFEFIFLGTIFCILVMPSLINEFRQMGILLQKYAESEWNVPYLPAAIHEFIKRNIDFNALANMLTEEQWMALAENALSTSWGIITGGIRLILGLFNWMLVLLYVIFIMIDYDRLGRGMRWMVPPKFRHTVFGIAHDVKESMNHYFRGQALVAFIVGILFAIGFSIVGLPLAIPLGLLIGLMNMVPYLQLASIPLTAFLCVIYSVGTGAGFWPIFWQSILVYCVVQAIQDLFLTPKILGKAMGLNPAIILLSLSIWGSLLGIIGMIIALPLTTLLIAYYDRYIIARQGRRALQNAEKIEHTPGD